MERSVELYEIVLNSNKLHKEYYEARDPETMQNSNL
jgi:hypothetical protein